MGKKKAKAPAAPNYNDLALKQAAASNAVTQTQTTANRANQIGPMGSKTWAANPTTGVWEETVTMDPAQKAALESAQRVQGGAMADLEGQGAWQGGPALPEYEKYQFNRGAMPEYDAAAGEKYADRFTESLMGRLRPQQQQDQERINNRLRLQGLQPGTEAYDRAYKNLLTSQGDVNAQANLQGMMAGGQEARNIYQAMLAGQQQDFGQQLGMAGHGLDEYGAQLQGQNQGYTQSMQDYLMPWQRAQMAQGIVGGVEKPQFDSYIGANAAEAPRIMDAAQQDYAQKMQAYNAAQEKQGSKMGMIGQIGGAAAGSLLGPLGTKLGASLGGALANKIGG
jgi:hypothetical protein